VPDPFELERFVEAQAGVYARVRGELERGEKRSHWMWFIFPQLLGLGASPMARRYAIRSLEEARAYLAHPVLGPRLHECVGALLALEGRSAEEVLGGVDALKLRSSMTLFALADPGETAFPEVLGRYCGGVPDERTEAALGESLRG